MWRDVFGIVLCVGTHCTVIVIVCVLCDISVVRVFLYFCMFDVCVCVVCTCVRYIMRVAIVLSVYVFRVLMLGVLFV